MTFISYSQNFEDVILWRALKDVEIGFYIDVGANDPNHDSVTKAFYDRGWHGINIEPVAQWHENLMQERPRDINLQLAAGSVPGDVMLYELVDTGLSTMEKPLAERHALEHGFKIVEREVSVRPLTEICQEFHIAPIHFLKIDVEGAEKQVLQGLDFSIIRPWIVVIESTLPSTQIEDFQGWESILTEAKYEFVYFDGLNRFYVACEHSDLKRKFSSPPNVFDGFNLVGSQPFCRLLTSKKDDLDLSLKECQSRYSLLQKECEAAQKDLGNRLEAAQSEMLKLCAAWNDDKKKLIEVHRSISWRITKPLRLMSLLVRTIFSTIKSCFRRVVIHTIKMVISNVILRRTVRKCVWCFPYVYKRLYRLASAEGMIQKSINEPKAASLSRLTPRANKILDSIISADPGKNGEIG